MSEIHLKIFLTLVSLIMITGVDWNSYPARQIVYNRYILEGLRQTRTLEKDKIDLTENDIDLLSAADGVYSVERTRAAEKLSKKAEALQCVSGLILIGNLESLRTFNGYRKDDITENDNDIARTLALFYMLKTYVRGCFWRIHIKIKAYTTMYSDQSPESFFSDLDGYINDIRHYCERCERDGYMMLHRPPPSDEGPSPEVPGLADQIERLLLEPKKLLQLYNYKLDIWNLEMTINVDAVCQSFSQVTWKAAKSRMMESRKCIIFESLNSTWHRNPYRYVQFQTIVLRIIQANVTHLVLVHLKTYVAYVKRYDLHDIRTRLTPFWLLLREPLSSAVDILDVRKGILWSLSYHMSTTEEIDVDSLNIMISYMEKRLKMEYHDLDVPRWQWGFNDLKLSVLELGETTDFITEEFVKNTTLLREYVERVRLAFRPINIYFIRFFLNGKHT